MMNHEMLTKDELEIILDLLEELTDYQSNAGCNDFWFPKKWSKEQVHKFEQDMKEYQVSAGYGDEQDLPYISDSEVTYFLMGRLKQIRRHE